MARPLATSPEPIEYRLTPYYYYVIGALGPPPGAYKYPRATHHLPTPPKLDTPYRYPL